jgi:hypothetical protein
VFHVHKQSFRQPFAFRRGQLPRLLFKGRGS